MRQAFAIALLIGSVVLGNVFWLLAVRHLTPNRRESALRIYVWTKPFAPRDNFTALGWRYRNLALAMVAIAVLMVFFAVP